MAAISLKKVSLYQTFLTAGESGIGGRGERGNEEGEGEGGGKEARGR